MTAFVIFGATPSLLVGGWCLSRNMSSCAQNEANELASQLGLLVKLDGMKHLRPGVVLYDQIELADPETGRTIFRSRWLEVAWQQKANEQGKLRPTLSMIATQPEVETSAVDLAWRWTQRLMESRPGRGETDVEFSADGITLRAGDRSQTLAEVAGLLETQSSGTQLQVDFQMPGDKSKERASLCIRRNRETSPPANCFDLSTGDVELPCSVLALAFGKSNPLGERSRFHGRIWADESPDGWQGEVAGQLVDLDLDRLVSDHFPHRLSGEGKVTSLSAHFRNGRLEEGNAILEAKNGTIGRSLVDAVMSRLDLVGGPEPLPSGSKIPFQELALSATLDSHGLRLRGLCKSAEQGTILSDGRNRLLGESSRELQPAGALVQALAPRNAVLVPVSRQTDWLQYHLPVPDVLPSPGVEPIPPTARLKTLLR